MFPNLPKIKFHFLGHTYFVVTMFADAFKLGKYRILKFGTKLKDYCDLDLTTLGHKESSKL